MSDMRYTDADVRNDPRLLALAEDYAFNYQGDFSPVVNAKALLQADDQLPIGVARMVLNTMRCDARVANTMPSPTPAPPRRIEPKLPKLKIRYPFDLATHWKCKYYYSVHPRAQVVHLLNTERSRIRYWPMSQQYKVSTWAVCGAVIHVLEMSNEYPEGRRMCRTCLEFAPEE
jgi:hypothetical protein